MSLAIGLLGASLNNAIDTLGGNLSYFRLFGGFEGVLAETAPGAYPIVGNVLESSAGSNAGVGIANFRIVLVTAGADVLHSVSSLST